MSKTELTAERLREMLDYDPETGVFRWRLSRGRARAGAVAGLVNRLGYVQIRIDRVCYLAHRLAWLWMTAAWPVAEIDHRDLRRANNSWLNLRAADPAQQRQNAPRPRSNSSGYKGVRVDRARFRAQIGYGYRMIGLGSFATAEEAHRAYCAAAAKLYGEFGRAE